MLLDYELNSITLSNLDVLYKRQERLEGQRLCEINELATDFSAVFLEMAQGDYGIYEILSFISESLASCELTRSDKIGFCRRLLDIVAERGFKLTENSFLQSEHKGGRVAFVKSILSNEAYDVFSQDLKSPRLLYTDTMSSSVMAVVRGEAEYCILPFEEKGGVRVSTVGELLFKHDLKINTVTPVFGPEGNADMRYALIAKNFTIPKTESDDDRYLEVRLRKDSSIPLSELLSASENYRFSIYRINSVRFFEDGEDVEYYSLVFSAEGRDFVPLLTYLTLFSGVYTPVGIYKNLE